MQSRTEDDRSPDNTGETVIPLAAEEIEVSKQVVETGRVQVARVTHEREQLIDELLAHETVEIDRTPVGRQLDTMPAIREEGEDRQRSCRDGARQNPPPAGRDRAAGPRRQAYPSAALRR